jgi:hypothetical protein
MLFEELPRNTPLLAWHPCCGTSLSQSSNFATPIMKPTSQISRQPKTRSGEDSPVRRHNNPITDYSFHAPAPEARAGSCKISRPVFAPGFRDLSNEFLGAETKRNYVAELLFFTIIVGISTWPIVSMLRAMGQLVR